MSLKIGVFICHCGTNIGGVVDVPGVVAYAAGLSDVVWAEENLYTCSDDGLASIRDKIAAHELNRVLVASCTPRTHEPLFKKNCELAGLNKYLFEFVNLREHCSWVHKERPGDATRKAKDLVRMGVAKVRLLLPQKDEFTAVIPTTLIIGAGISGLSATLSLANQGYQVELIEKNNCLGGLLKDVNRVFPSDAPAESLLDPLIKAVNKHSHVRVHLDTELSDIKGFIGNFSATVRKNKKTETLTIGTVIVAVGADEFKPRGILGYQQFDNVLTQLEFEQRYRLNPDGLKRVVLVNCVGARIDDRPYCSRFCCITAMKNAILIKEADPEAEVTILQRDIMACGTVFEEYYQRALQMGVKFIRYNLNRFPTVSGTGRQARKLSVYDELTGRTSALKTDMIILTTPLVAPEDNHKLSRMLKIPVGSQGFFMEAHQKLRPVEFPADGIFIAGCARYPAEISECVAQGYAAAAKAAGPMSQGQVVSEAYTSEINPLHCSACGRCIQICPFGAIDWVDCRGAAGEVPMVVQVNSAECKGCGLCVASCLSGAIQLKGFTDEEIFAMVSATVV